MKFDRELLKKYKILIAESADECIENAGVALQTYLEKSMSVNLPITKDIREQNVIVLTLTNVKEASVYSERLVSDGFAIFVSNG